jgi:uncharacterized protein (TIGR00156 family)
MLKNILITITLLSVSISAVAEFVGPGARTINRTVSEIPSTKEGARIILVGKLINQVDDEYYTFQDDTGQMVVEIHPDELIEIMVTPKTKIKLLGEVDDGKHNSKVDVDHIVILD